MDEWFKARLSWGSSIRMLSDAEAGRFVKALWSYAESREVGSLTGGERLLIAMCTATLDQDEAHRSEVSAKRSQAGKQGGRPRNSKANESKKSNSFNEKANESKKSNCLHIRNKNKESSPFPPSQGADDDVEELLLIARRNDEVYAAAERAGFPRDGATLDKLTELISLHGPDAVEQALDACVEYGAKSIAYLRKVLDGSSKPQKGATTEELNGGYKPLWG